MKQLHIGWKETYTYLEGNTYMVGRKYITLTIFRLYCLLHFLSHPFLLHPQGVFENELHYLKFQIFIKTASRQFEKRKMYGL